MTDFKIYTLTFVFSDDSVLLIESNKFPGLFNGIGGIITDDFYLTDSYYAKHAEAAIYRELGGTMSVPMGPSNQFATLNGLDYQIACFRVHEDLISFNPDHAENPERFVTDISFDSIWHVKDKLAPRVPMLIAAAQDDLGFITVIE